jgi:hypothetical protein
VGPDLDLSGRITPRDQSLWQAAFARGARSSVPPAVRLSVGAVGGVPGAAPMALDVPRQVVGEPRAPGTPDADGLLRESDFPEFDNNAAEFDSHSRLYRDNRVTDRAAVRTER